MTQSEARPVAGLRERQREARDESILQSAYTLMDEHGYEAMTMDDLAEKVGISKRTLYHHFPSKEAIVVRAVVVLIANSEQQVRSMSAGKSSRERLEDVMRWMIGNKLNPPKGPVAYLKAQPTLMSAVRTNPAYRSAIASYLGAFAEVVAEAQRDGFVKRELDSKVIAQLVVGFIRGAEFDDILTAKNRTAEELADMIVGSLMHGFMTTPRIGEPR